MSKISFAFLMDTGIQGIEERGFMVESANDTKTREAGGKLMVLCSLNKIISIFYLYWDLSNNELHLISTLLIFRRNIIMKNTGYTTLFSIFRNVTSFRILHSTSL